MRRGTVRTGLRLLVFAVSLLILGTFYGQQVNTMLAISDDGAAEFVRLTFFWGAVLGGAAIVMIPVGLLQRSPAGEKVRLLPTLFFLILLLVTFFTIFYRTLTAPPQPQPLRPGETVII